MNITLISSAIAAAIAFSVAWQLQSARLSDLKTEYATKQAQAVEKAHAQTIALQAKADAAARNYAARATTLANAAAGARTDLERLRDTIATGPMCMPSNPGTSSAVHADPIRELLAECAGAVTDLAAKADGHASDALMLFEAWPQK